jgi:hypothetical protein
MTMVYHIKDPAMLTTFKAVDKVRFDADHVNGQFIVTTIQKCEVIVLSASKCGCWPARPTKPFSTISGACLERNVVFGADHTPSVMPISYGAKSRC